ncbi:hypothetical protein BaRGS_00027555 [Batillaria attramentaria]|uniref:Secreted protein n=1 Tax=Batillaria attramentaria TaxID=370345 RepID=A0ABD0K1L0_9CAEN
MSGVLVHALSLPPSLSALLSPQLKAQHSRAWVIDSTHLTTALEDSTAQYQVSTSVTMHGRKQHRVANKIWNNAKEKYTYAMQNTERYCHRTVRNNKEENWRKSGTVTNLQSTPDH